MKKAIKRIIIGICVLGVIGAVASNGSDDEKVTKVSSTETTSSSSSSEVVEATESTSSSEEVAEEVTEEDSVFNVGDVAITDDIQITFVSCGEYNEENEFLQPNDGYKYVGFQFEIENVSDSDYYVSSFSCYADGYSCDEYYYGDDGLEFTTISSGRKAKGYVYFSVPEDAEDIQVEFSYDILSSDKIIFQYE